MKSGYDWRFGFLPFFAVGSIFDYRPKAGNEYYFTFTNKTIEKSNIILDN